MTSLLVQAQSLLKSNSWSLGDAPKNVFFDQGAFYYKVQDKLTGTSSKQEITSIRTAFDAEKKRERIVLDFSSEKLVGIYGYISKEKRKLYIDLHQTEKVKDFNSQVKGKYLKSVDIYVIEPKLLSIEFSFPEIFSFEIFTLSNPTRLVIDVKK